MIGLYYTNTFFNEIETFIGYKSVLAIIIRYDLNVYINLISKNRIIIKTHNASNHFSVSLEWFYMTNTFYVVENIYYSYQSIERSSR